MISLVTQTAFDLRCGRTSWRVLMLLEIPALFAGVIAGLFW